MILLTIIIYHNWRKKGKTCSHVSFDREEDFLAMKRLDNNIGFFFPRAAGRIIKPGVCEINKKKRGGKKKIGDKVKDTLGFLDGKSTRISVG